MNLFERITEIISSIPTHQKIDVDGPGAGQQASTRTIRVDFLKAKIDDVLLKSSRINLAVITHRHGANPYVHQTEEGLRDLITDYCTGEWDDELPETPIPDNAEEICEVYFELVETEFVNYYFDVEVTD